MRNKINKFLLVFLAVAGLSFGRSRISGFCEDGNKTVTTLTIISTTTVQQSYPSCTVTVYNTGTVTLSAIYSDDLGTVQANPFIATSTGYWFFYADNNVYDVAFSNGGIPTPFTLGGKPTLDPKRIGGVRYADTFPGADPCLQIQAAIADLPGYGGVVDARGIQGTVACSVDPFNNVPNVNLLLGATIYQTTAPWVVTTGSRLIGIGREIALASNTIIQAVNPGFPTSTPVISLCNAPGPCFGVQVESLEMDCNLVAGCTGGYNAYSQEQSWFRKVLAINAPAYGIWVDGNPGGVPTFAVQNSGPYEDIEVLPESAGITTTVCFRADLVVAFRGIYGITCNGANYSSRPTNAIVVEGSSANIQNVHIEHFTNGVVLGTSLFSTDEDLVENVETGPDVTTSVIIGPTGPGTSQDIMIFGVANSTAASNTLIDNVNTITIDNSVGLGFYVLGVGGAGTQTVITSRNDIRVNFQTNVRILKNLAIPGTLNNDSKISLNNQGTYTIIWHDSGTSGEPGPVIQTGNAANGHQCLLVQNTDQPSLGAVGGGLCINGGGFQNLPGYGAVGAGYTGDMGTIIVRAANLAGMFIENGVIKFESQTGATPGASASLLVNFRINTDHSVTFPNPVALASLGSPSNFTLQACSDCTNGSNPCVGGGGGAIAKRLNGAWDCR